MTLTFALAALSILAAQSAEPGSPCRTIEPTAAQRATEFRNAVANGRFAMRTMAGESSCQFNDGQGQCRLRDPRLVHITVDGRHSWFEVGAGRSARIDVSGGRATCTVMRDVRTD